MKKVQLIAISLMVLLLAACGNKVNYSKLEKELKTKATDYYEENLKGKVLGVTTHQITLAAMETAGVDIENFTESECKKDSYALILLKLDDEKKVTEYEVENHLTCGDYKTENE